MFELDGKVERKQSDVQSVEQEDEDIIIEDVAPVKKDVPMFTKKGKLTLALIVVGGFIYYLWSKKQASAQPQQAEQPAETKVEETPKAEEGGETIDVVDTETV